MASPIWCSSPGCEANPRSSPKPMVMLVSVTPWSVAPLADPGPQGDASVPNLVPADADDFAVVVVDPAELLLLREDPHPAATRTSTSRTPSQDHGLRFKPTPRWRWPSRCA